MGEEERASFKEGLCVCILTSGKEEDNNTEPENRRVWHHVAETHAENIELFDIVELEADEGVHLRTMGGDEGAGRNQVVFECHELGEFVCVVNDMLSEEGLSLA